MNTSQDVETVREESRGIQIGLKNTLAYYHCYVLYWEISELILR